MGQAERLRSGRLPGRPGADLEALARVADRIAPTTLAGDQLLRVLPALEGLFPGGGLRRGTQVSVDGPAAMSLALATAAGPSQDGAWVAAVGFASLGLLAAAELGIALERLVLVADPGHPDADGPPSGGPPSEDPPSLRGPGGDAWSSVVAALVDAFEVVLVAVPGDGRRVGSGDARRLAARTRERGAVLVRVGTSGPTGSAWPEGADVDLSVTGATWEGLGTGHGHLRARRVQVTATGRRGAARPRSTELWLPAHDGAVEVVAPDPVPLRPRSDGARPATPPAAPPVSSGPAVPVAIR